MHSTILIEWSSGLSVNVPSIDEQHKKLVNMINALNHAMERGLTDEAIQSIFDGLLAYTNKHFEYEEELLNRTGFPASAAHEREHASLRSRVVEMQERVARGEMVLGVEVMDFLRDWLVNHIMGSDRAYSKHLVEHGIR